ncbi:MAG: T9SS type A sorting domain-containing protein [Flavobacteriales bacterium]|nr:T9SS type A sorting domain-containing protein [Flavobacteriales bacterium]
MKKILPLIIFSLSILFSSNMMGQCPTCVPDESCTSADGFPAVCPLVQPNATAGNYYEEQLTFFMPAEITDPGSGINATLLSVTITSVSGLPYGLQFTLNDPDATYLPSDGENFGCATICGVPLLPGTYSVMITVSALVNALGFEVTQVESFESVLIVDPGQGSANSFSFDNIADCGGLYVNYDALIVVPEPSVVEYSWDFGNGQQSAVKTPPTVFYDEIGDHEVELTTTISDWYLDVVTVSTLNDNWSGDIDDLISTADPYFQIFDGDGNLVYAAAPQDNTTSTSWIGLSYLLSNPPYAIQFFDDDDISADDDLGSTMINLTEGANIFDVGNGTTGVINVTLAVTNAFSDSITVSVLPIPDATIIQNGEVLSFTDPTLTTFTWYRNDVPIQDANTASYTMTEGGEYYAIVGNEFGCTVTSEPVLYCPSFNITFDAVAMEVSVADIYDSYQWYFNGLEVSGATSSYLAVTETGNYAVEITTSYGCTTTSEVLTVDLAVDENTHDGVVVYPNPASQILYLNLIENHPQTVVNIYDLTGRIIAAESIVNNNSTASISISTLAPGIYFAEVNHQRIRFIKR